MRKANTATPEFTARYEDVVAAERSWLIERRLAAGMADDGETVGLALSGGGIRSATFNLGVLEALQRHGLLKQIDYVSSVSGGGYIASCLTWLRAHVPTSDARTLAELPVGGGRGTVLDWLRAHGKYLISERGFSGWTLGASILAAVLLNLFVMMPPLLLLIGLATVEWLPVNWPAWLNFPGPEPIRAHDGYVLLFWAGIASLLFYLVTVVAFAFISGVRALRTHVAILRVRRAMGFFLNAGIALFALGLLPLVVSIEEAVVAYFEIESLQRWTKIGTVAVPILTGAAAMRRADSQGRKTGRNTRGLATVGLAILLYGLAMFAYHLVAHTGMLGSYWLWAAAALSFLLAMLCDINWVSMHSYYRSRLADGFMPPVEVDGTVKRDAQHFKLSEISATAGGPYQIVNTTLNTSSSANQKLRGRGGENFVMTPLFCGSEGTGYRRTTSYRDGRTTLSTAFTISGAAVDPNTYATRSRPVAFVMALLNFRLGFWAPNPRFASRRLPLPWWYIFIGREMLGHGLCEHTRHVHLSDGGHFENLGVYELLRRRCRRIIVCDAGADPQTTLSDLGKAVQRSRVDFGARVDIKADHLERQARQEMSETPFAIGQIAYADGSEGELLYIKPLMCAGVTVDIYAYWRDNPTFPNQSTANQFFGEEQFNAYRELGLQIVDGIAGSRPVATIAELLERAREALDGR